MGLLFQAGCGQMLAFHTCSIHLSFMGDKSSSKYLPYFKHQNRLCTLLISTPWPILDLHKTFFSSCSLHSKIPSQQISWWVLHFQDSVPNRISLPSGSQTWQWKFMEASPFISKIIDDVPLKHHETSILFADFAARRARETC